MSRSGYSEDCENGWALIRWRGAVNSAIKGKRGQAFFKELLAALDALPEKKLIAHDLEKEGAVCTLGAVGRARGMTMALIDPEDHHTVANQFNIPHALACEIMWMNDDAFWRATPEDRFTKMRAWVESQIKPAHAGSKDETNAR